MGFGETIFLFLLALVIFGPKKLPEIARQLGRALNEVKKASNEFKAQIEQEVQNLEREEARKSLPPASPPEGVVVSRNQLSEAAESAPSESTKEASPQDSSMSPPSSDSTSVVAAQESHG